MTTLLLLRHGRSTANTSGVLAGWTPGVELDDVGRGQAQAVAQRLLSVPLAAVVSSPLERCQQTASAVLAARNGSLPSIDDRLGECHYGDWTGQEIKKLAKDPLWKVVQQHPSAAVFPGPDGEGLAQTQSRAVAAVREWDAKIRAEHGDAACWLACSHADVIKAITADALGMHLDLFQRIMVDPGSLTIIRYTETRPFVVKVNDTGSDLAALLPPQPKRRRKQSALSSDAVVGGGAGGGH